jgi:Acetamidase/Formamidase family
MPDWSRTVHGLGDMHDGGIRRARVATVLEDVARLPRPALHLHIGDATEHRNRGRGSRPPPRPARDDPREPRHPPQQAHPGPRGRDAGRNALLNMIDHLGTRGYDRQQVYAICSCAVDLRISQTVDVPNFIVSAFLPPDIFI